MTVASNMHEPGTCDQCGRFEAVEFGDRWLCPDCIANRGSCCQECEMEDAAAKLIFTAVFTGFSASGSDASLPRKPLTPALPPSDGERE